MKPEAAIIGVPGVAVAACEWRPRPILSTMSAYSQALIKRARGIRHDLGGF